MFSLSDIREEAFPATFRKGKDYYERGAVKEFRHEIYTVENLPVADITARVDGTLANSYQVKATIDEEFGDIQSYSCECDAFYNYNGLCKHCVAVLMTYINKRTPKDIIDARNGKAVSEGQEEELEQLSHTTTNGLKNLLNQYALRANTVYMLPETIYGKVDLEPHFELDYGYARLEFKIGMEHKYVLKNISAFLYSIHTSEKVHYGKKLDFYHNMNAFSEHGQRMISFMREQDEDKKRQSQFHAYYVHSGSFERTMELDALGIDRFFAAMGDDTFFATLGYDEELPYQMAEEPKVPQLTLRGCTDGVYVILEDLNLITGRDYYYFYDGGILQRTKPEFKENMSEFFEFLTRQIGNECFVGMEELPVFCRDLLPQVREHFLVQSDGFDETLYVPPKPEFELFLDRKAHDLIGAKLVSVYGAQKYNVLSKVKTGEVRDMSEELRIRSLVEPYFNEKDASGTLFILKKDEDMLYQLISGGLARLSSFMSIYTSEAFRGLKVVSSPSVEVGVNLKSDLLELQIHSPEMPGDELAYLLSKYDRKKKYIRLKNGDFLDVTEDGVSLLAEISEDLRLTEANLKKGTVLVPKYRAMYLDASLKNMNLLTVEKNKEFKAMVRDMKTIEDSDFEVADSLKNVMRSYQKNGFMWLKTLRENGFGGILADDMGLGKTLQVISLLVSEKEECDAGEKEPRRSLIVCPASLVYNWQKEVERFAPELETVLITGSAPERKDIIKGTREGQILITSYDLLKRDVEHYKDIIFSIQVIDEAQYIKNAGTQAAKGVKQITAGFKLALTGTPIENRLSELWSIFDYLMPGFLYTYQKFREEIELPIVQNQDANKMERLQRMIRPFILRRLKGDVLKDLPEKLEENVFAKLGGEQLALYDAHVQNMRQMLEKKSDAEFKTEKFQILAELTKLRQLCCDPALLFEDYAGESAKSDMCMELIENAVNGGHKVLLFSQFTSMLDRLCERLDKAGISFFKLTGSVNKEKRMQMVESFNQDDTSVFCISLKAGGTGLNLTSADIVIHYDPWWNVAVQNQATDRAHRIGQKNIVTVYKLVSEGTIEEKIVQIQEKKKHLAEQVLEGDGMDSIGFTKDEIMALLA